VQKERCGSGCECVFYRPTERTKQTGTWRRRQWTTLGAGHWDQLVPPSRQWRRQGTRTGIAIGMGTGTGAGIGIGTGTGTGVGIGTGTGTGITTTELPHLNCQQTKPIKSSSLAPNVRTSSRQRLDTSISCRFVCRDVARGWLAVCLLLHINLSCIIFWSISGKQTNTLSATPPYFGLHSQLLVCMLWNRGPMDHTTVRQRLPHPTVRPSKKKVDGHAACVSLCTGVSTTRPLCVPMYLRNHPLVFHGWRLLLGRHPADNVVPAAESLSLQGIPRLGFSHDFLFGRLKTLERSTRLS